MTDPVDILVLSLGTTLGLRIADGQLAQLLREAGATVAVAGVRIGAAGRLRRGYPVNDLVKAVAARRALVAALRRHAPRAVIFSPTTAELLARPPRGVSYGVWLDAPARLNRPGRRNAVVHLLERRSLRDARRVLVLSPPAAAALPARAAPAVVVAPRLPRSPRDSAPPSRSSSPTPRIPRRSLPSARHRAWRAWTLPCRSAPSWRAC